MEWPVLVGAVPPLADRRVDRPADRHLADAVAHAGGTGVMCQVLSGLGGVGKTQVAAALAHQVWNTGQVDLLVWVTATSRTAILTGFAQAAARVTGVDDTDPERGAAHLLGWLAEPHQRRWLIVLDNLDSPDDLTGLWPPTTAFGRTVVTTRRRDTALLTGRHAIDVDVFTPDQAVAYLHSKLADQPHRLDQADALAADLGYLPLALAQAAAYLLDQGLDCAGYRHRLADQRRRRLADLAPDALPDEHRSTVADTWSLSIDLADRLAPAGLARPLLELAALLDPNSIPTGLFAAAAVTAYCTTRLGRPVDGEDTHDALRLLHRFSLATIDDTGTTMRVHALVQRATRDQLTADQITASARTAADALIHAWPDVERDTALTEALRANTTALHATTGDALWTIPVRLTGWRRILARLVGFRPYEAHEVLHRAGNSLGEIGLVTAARDYFARLRVLAAQHLGPDHPNTLTIRNDLAWWCVQAGDLAGVATDLEQLLTDYLRVLGPDHPQTLTTRNNLAHWRGHTGDPAGAAAALEELLTDQLRVLGPDHPNILANRANLAHWRGHTGDPAGAATAIEELLTDQLRVLGADHPNILAIRSELAYWRGHTDDPAGAAAAFEELLTDQLRVLGPDHPHTLATRASLAVWRGRAGDPAGAAAAFEELLTDELRVLGPDHPDTLATGAAFAAWRGQAGDPAGAAAALEELLTEQLRVLGPDHPYTLTTRSEVAWWRGQAGDPAGAAAAFEELLTDRLRVLGPDHPDTLAIRHDLAAWRGEAGDPAGAAAAFEELLTDRLRVLGPDHPDTLATRASLAAWRGEAGGPAGAATALGGHVRAGGVGTASADPDS
ncbi:tetratricopeptide repeat protein [Dactylosporangium salmoneum]|uniref:tetratricopeptide repeat protein n=1 Tax=Dactylosporangium salmoneum TaxID=53361 RepID=UPI0031E29032